MDRHHKFTSTDNSSVLCPAYEMKNQKKQGAMDRSFLLDTVRNISRHRNFSA